MLENKTQRIEKIVKDIISSLKEVRIPEKEKAYEKVEITGGYKKSFEFFHEISLSAKKKSC